MLTNILLYPRNSDLFSVDLVLSQTENMGCKYIKADFLFDVIVGMQEWWKLHIKHTVFFRANHTPNISLPHYSTKLLSAPLINYILDYPCLTSHLHIPHYILNSFHTVDWSPIRLPLSFLLVLPTVSPSAQHHSHRCTTPIILTYIIHQFFPASNLRHLSKWCSNVKIYRLFVYNMILLLWETLVFPCV